MPTGGSEPEIARVFGILSPNDFATQNVSAIGRGKNESMNDFP